MPGGRGKPRRACPMCNWYKYLGNNAGRLTYHEEVAREAAEDALRDPYAEEEVSR